jgi:hypothetical protein
VSCSVAKRGWEARGVIRPAGRQRSRRFASEEAAREFDESMCAHRRVERRDRHGHIDPVNPPTKRATRAPTMLSSRHHSVVRQWVQRLARRRGRSCKRRWGVVGLALCATCARVRYVVVLTDAPVSACAIAFEARPGAFVLAVRSS